MISEARRDGGDGLIGTALCDEHQTTPVFHQSATLRPESANTSNTKYATRTKLTLTSTWGCEDTTVGVRHVL